VDKYFVHVTTRSSWLFSASMPAAASAKKKKNLQAAAGGDSTKLRRDTVKKPAAMSKEKEGEANKKAKVKKEEGQNAGAARVWLCKKNDGKRWHCNRPVSQPDTLCEYHFVQKRSYLNPDFEPPSVAKLEEAAPVPVPVPAAASNKSSTRNKPRKKKPGSDLSATEGFYYYAGFGPFRSKRQCRSGGGMNGPVPAKQEEEDHAKDDDASRSQQQAEVDEAHDDTNQTATAARGDASSCEDDTAGIAGVDEGSSDDDFDGLGVSGHGMNGNCDPKASNGDGKRKIPWKWWRKPVKARSLKSLM